MLEKYYSANRMIMIHVGHYPPISSFFTILVLQTAKKNDKQNTAGLILAPTVVFSTVLVEKSIVVQVEHQPPGSFANPTAARSNIPFWTMFSMQILPRQQRQQSLSTGKEYITTYYLDNSECTLYILPKDIQICAANTKVHRPPAPHTTPCCLRRAKYCVILRLKQPKSTHMRYVKVRSSPVMQQHVVYIEFTVFVAWYLASNLI